MTAPPTIPEREDPGGEPPLYMNDRELHRRMAPHMGWDAFKAAIKAVEDKHGFPRPSALWKGRYWPAVKAWCDIQEGIEMRPAAPQRVIPAVPDGYEQREEFVYFAFCGDRVKIGYTTNWKDRFRVLSTAAPTNISPFVVIKGSRKREGELHEKFAHLRANGEWFEATGELLDFVKAIPRDAERIR